MIKVMIKAMIESVARITTVHGKHSGEFRRVACTLHVSLSKQQRAEEHPRAFETASRRCTKRTEGQKDRRTEGPIDKRSRCTTRAGGQEDGSTEGRKDGRTDRQTDKRTTRETDTPRTTRETDNPRNGQMDQPQGPCREVPSCRAQKAAALPATVRPPSTS
jgi:hypothetical protein